MYKFEVANRFSPLSDPEHTLGIEITDPQVAAQCGLGNIDPQHGHCHRAPERSRQQWPSRGGALAAIDFSHRFEAPCPSGTTFATTRADVDSVGSMAVFVLLALGHRGGADVAARVGLIAERDAFRPAKDAPRPPLPTLEQPWPPESAIGPVDCSQRLSALGVFCSPNPRQGQHEYPMGTRVALMACWLLWGDPPGPSYDGRPTQWFAGSNDPGASVLMAEICRACDVDCSGGPTLAEIYRAAKRTANEARLDLARALADGRMIVSVQDEIAVVRGLHMGALGVGYSQADVVVAEQVDPRTSANCFGASTQPRKITIAAREGGLVDFAALRARLNAAEEAARGPGTTWGGPVNLLGSPEGGSVLPLDEIASLVQACKA